MDACDSRRALARHHGRNAVSGRWLYAVVCRSAKSSAPGGRGHGRYADELRAAI